MRKPTQKEIDSFITYRGLHVALVQKLGKVVFDMDFSDHDADKINAVGRNLELFALRKASKEGDLRLSKDDKNELRKVSARHAKSQKHHAEYWDPSITIKNFKADDTNIIVARNMPKRYLAEMTCDWASCALYHNEPILDWYNKVIDDTLFLTNNQKEYLLECLQKIEKVIQKENIQFPGKDYNCDQVEPLQEDEGGCVSAGDFSGSVPEKPLKIIEPVKSEGALELKENKDHLIDRLNIENEQKEALKAFFKKYPNYESKIDWNNKDLTFDDFKELLSNEGKSKSQAKKNGLAGLKEGEDYIILDQKPDFIAYRPLTYLGSKTIASNAVPPVKENGAKWCTAYQKTREYWDDYTRKGIRFCYVCTEDTKYALVQYSSKDSFKQECYSFEDYRVPCPVEFKYLYDKLLSEKVGEEVEKRKHNARIYLLKLYKEWAKTGVAFLPEDFSGREFITNVTIPNSVTSIENYAFSGCTNLATVTIPNTVTNIGAHAFYMCENLTNITIPDSVTSIGSSAFSGCGSLKSITIPNSMTSIGGGAFFRCTGLKNITIPNSVTSIGNEAFYGCTDLTSITIPDSVTSIGDNAFYSCRSLTSISIPNSVTNMGISIFRECNKLTNITIPNSVTSINHFAFEYCTGLKSITIPNSVTSIESYAFFGCNSLASIMIPDSVTKIGAYSLQRCNNLIIHYQGTKTQWEKIKGFKRIKQPIIFEKG